MDATVWYSQGSNLATLNRFAEALHCYDQGLALDPRNAMPWINKALVEERLGRRTDAVRSYKRFIELAPIENAADVEYAQRRLRALEGS
jgi:tetratricopeptide (TPR) repeat protein